jgi:hypothetical protein
VSGTPYRSDIDGLIAHATEHSRLLYQHRYYCPTCGEVAYGYPTYKGIYRVDDHAKWSEEGRYRRCPGGFIDKDKDKAP